MKTLIIPLLAAITLVLAGCESNGGGNVDSTNSGTRATGAGATGAGGASGGGAGSAGMGVGGTSTR